MLITKRELLCCTFLVFLLFSVSCSGGGGSNDSSDKAHFSIDACQAIGMKVVNGNTCQLSSSAGGSPVVRITFVDSFGTSGLCSGAAISSTVVLTAAHCFLDGVSSIRVDTVFGALSVANIIIHPSVRVGSSALFNDAALIVTTSPMGVGTFPILMSRDVVVGEEAIVTGYGDTGSGKFGFLQAGNILISSVSNNHIFTDFTGDGSNPCQGDSGAPLLVKQNGEFAIAGIVSTGRADIDNCGIGDVTLYTSLSNISVQNFIFDNEPNALVL
jgi:secreted trypsin-like serine protease